MYSYLTGYSGSVRGNLDSHSKATLGAWSAGYSAEFMGGPQIVNVTGGDKNVFELDLGEWTPTPYTLGVDTCTPVVLGSRLLKEDTAEYASRRALFPSISALDTILWVGASCPGQAPSYYATNTAGIVDPGQDNLPVWYELGANDDACGPNGYLSRVNVTVPAGSRFIYIVVGGRAPGFYAPYILTWQYYGPPPSPSSTQTPSFTPTSSLTASMTATLTASMTSSGTATMTPSSTMTGSLTGTMTPSMTHTSSHSGTPSKTSAATPTATTNVTAATWGQTYFYVTFSGGSCEFATATLTTSQLAAFMAIAAGVPASMVRVTGVTNLYVGITYALPNDTACAGIVALGGSRLLNTWDIPDWQFEIVINTVTSECTSASARSAYCCCCCCDVHAW